MPENFFVEYTPTLLASMLITGFVLGLIAGRICWGSYKSAIGIAEAQEAPLRTELNALQTRNQQLKSRSAKV